MEMEHAHPWTQIIARDEKIIDTNLPHWARRSNPIVKRELGGYWKVLPPDPAFYIKLVSIDAVLLFLVPTQVLLGVTQPLAGIALVAIPALLFMYTRALFTVVDSCATSIVRAHQNNTLDLVRVSDLPLSQILLGKIAASVWRGLDDIAVTLFGIGLLAGPLLLLQYVAFSAYSVPLSRVGILLSLVAVLLRLILEPFMVGAVAQLVGSWLKTRATAVTVTLVLAAFYYAMLTVPRVAALPWAARVFIEAVLPVLLPLGLGLGALMLTQRVIEHQ